MKFKALGLLAVLGVSAGCASGQPTAVERRQAVRDSLDKTYRSTEGFQTVRWGMTPEEVRAELPEATVGPDGTLRMKTAIAEVQAEVALGFLDNRLAAVDVFFPDVADPRTFHSLMRDLLTRKYGEPRKPIEVARELKWQKLPIRFAADLAPVEQVEGSETVPTTESALSSQGKPKVINRWTTLESHVNLTQWSLPARSIVAIQYESAKYSPKRADLIGRYSAKARQDLVKEL